MAMADQKLRPAAALGRGPLHDYMAQLLSSFEEVQLQLGESATVRRECYEQRTPGLFEESALADPFAVDFSFPISGLRSCAFVSREATKLGDISSLIWKYAEQLEKMRTQEPAEHPLQLDNVRQPTDSSSSSFAIATIEEPKAEMPKEASPQEATKDGPPASAALSVSTPVRPAAQAVLRAPNSQLQSKLREMKARSEIKAAASNASSTKPTATLAESTSQSALPQPTGVKALAAMWGGKVSSATNVAEKSRLFAGKPLAAPVALSREAAAPARVSASPYLKEPLVTAAKAAPAPTQAPQVVATSQAAEVLPAPTAIPRPKGAASRARMRSGCLPNETPHATEQVSEVAQRIISEAVSEAAQETEPKAREEPIDNALFDSVEPDAEPVPPVESHALQASEEAIAAPVQEAPVEPVSEELAAAPAQMKAEEQPTQEPVMTPLPSKPAEELKEPKKKEAVVAPLSPKRDEDNYEISEKDENSDDGENEPDRSQKHVPTWCSSYLEALTAQMSWDPDTIFGSKVPPCDLNVVFTAEHYKRSGKERPNRKRGSSQDWKKDRLRSNEVKEYKRKMGQVKPWTPAMTPLGVHNDRV